MNEPSFRSWTKYHVFGLRVFVEKLYTHGFEEGYVCTYLIPQ